MPQPATADCVCVTCKIALLSNVLQDLLQNHVFLEENQNNKDCTSTWICLEIRYPKNCMVYHRIIFPMKTATSTVYGAHHQTQATSFLNLKKTVTIYLRRQKFGTATAARTPSPRLVSGIGICCCLVIGHDLLPNGPIQQ